MARNDSRQTEVILRDATPGDEAAIRALSDATHAAHRARLPHVFDADNGYQHELLDTVFGRPAPEDSAFRARIRTAHRDGALLGYVFVIWERAEDGTANALVADIAVTEAARGQGIARRLLADLQTRMEEAGWASLQADVWRGNPASEALFRGAGFETERVTYRFGTPVARPPAPPGRAASAISGRLWWAALVIVLLIALLAAAT